MQDFRFAPLPETAVPDRERLPVVPVLVRLFVPTAILGIFVVDTTLFSPMVRMLISVPVYTSCFTMWVLALLYPFERIDEPENRWRFGLLELMVFTTLVILPIPMLRLASHVESYPVHLTFLLVSILLAGAVLGGFFGWAYIGTRRGYWIGYFIGAILIGGSTYIFLSSV